MQYLYAIMLIGYARVSTGEQTTAAQVAALKTSGCELIFRDNASARAAQAAQSAPERRCVGRLDTRSPVTLPARCTDHHGAGAGAPRRLSQPQGSGGHHHARGSDDVMQMVGAFAEFERAMLKERTKGGPRRRAQGRPDRRPAAEAQAPPATGNCDARQAGEEDRRRRGAPVRRPPGNGVAATPADLDRVFYRTFGSIAPQAPISPLPQTTR